MSTTLSTTMIDTSAVNAPSLKMPAPLSAEKLFLQGVTETIDQTLRENADGLLLEMALDHFSETGKMLRPKVAFELSTYFKSSVPEGIAWASSCEILHNATLVHDDLQDGDLLRRGKRTTWNKYGALQAINLGDLLLLIANQPLLKADIPAEKLQPLLLLFSQMAAKIVGGQSLEPSLRLDLSDRSLKENYIRCISMKTSALFSGLAEGVCILAGVEKSEQKALAQIFTSLGNIFQIQDDILDLYGDKGRDSVGCDLKEGKVSYLIVCHLAHFPEDQKFLSEILMKERSLTTLEDIEQVLEIFREKSTLALAMQEMEEIVQLIERSRLMTENSKLKAYIDQLVGKILTPIQHLRSV